MLDVYVQLGPFPVHVYRTLGYVWDKTTGKYQVIST